MSPWICPEIVKVRSRRAHTFFDSAPEKQMIVTILTANSGVTRKAPKGYPGPEIRRNGGLYHRCDSGDKCLGRHCYPELPSPPFGQPRSADRESSDVKVQAGNNTIIIDNSVLNRSHLQARFLRSGPIAPAAAQDSL